MGGFCVYNSKKLLTNRKASLIMSGKLANQRNLATNSSSVNQSLRGPEGLPEKHPHPFGFGGNSSEHFQFL